MMLKSLDDSYVSALMILLESLIPFFTIGYLGMDIVLYISVAVGLIAMLAAIARMVYCIRTGKMNLVAPVTKTMVTYYSLPYVFLLSYFIMLVKGIEVEYVLWFAGIVFLLATPVAIKNSMMKGDCQAKYGAEVS